MASSPSNFLQQYKPITVHTETDTKYVHVKKYVSGDCFDKKWPAKAANDLLSFVHKKGRYKDKNFTGWHQMYDTYFWGDLMQPKFWADCTWKHMQLCFNGKGTPASFREVLRVVAYYLNHADIPLDAIGWSRRLTLQEYADYYFGLDCNGFTGSYYEACFPGTGITGNDHINYLEGKKTLTKRPKVEDVRVGDILVAEASSGANGRHVVLIDAITPLAAGKAQVTIAHAASSRDGLAVETMTLKQLSGTTGNGYGKYHFELTEYGKKPFHHALGPL